MNHEKDQERLNSIFQMVLEMGEGNFAGRIPRTGNDDELEALAVVINWLAEELHGSFFHMGFVNPRTNYRYATKCVLVLDSKFSIIDTDTVFPEFIGYEPSRLKHLKITSLLADASLIAWQQMVEGLNINKFSGAPEAIVFTGNDGQRLRVYCSLSRLSRSGFTILSVYSATSSSLREETNNPVLSSISGKENFYDPKLMQKVYDFILSNMDSSLPTLRSMARIFGTNEFKLKNSFKQLYGTTIHQFYNEERLKRAQLLIANTNIPLKNIANIAGFSNYPNFSRAFKIKFGYSPSDVKRVEK